MFITFDGPNGSGKTTIINKVKSSLEHKGYKVYATKEPTESKISQFIRSSEELYRKHTLASLVVADRHNHISEEILPKLVEGYIVLCDRYIISSLILQVLDGLDIDEIMKMNTSILKPDVCFILYASEDIINKRLDLREKLSRFEREYSSKKEIQLSFDAGAYLTNLGYDIEYIDTDKDINYSVETIERKIMALNNIS